MSAPAKPPPPGEVAPPQAVTERGSRSRTDPVLLDHARILRRDMTRQERHLWYDFLKTLPDKWYRQRPMGGYVLDFYCHSARLAIEIDGSQHFEETHQGRDAERTAKLEGLGVMVFRVTNTEVDRNFSGVCEAISSLIQERKEP